MGIASLHCGDDAPAAGDGGGAGRRSRARNGGAAGSAGKLTAGGAGSAGAEANAGGSSGATAGGAAGTSGQGGAASGESGRGGVGQNGKSGAGQSGADQGGENGQAGVAGAAGKGGPPAGAGGSAAGQDGSPAGAGGTAAGSGGSPGGGGSSGAPVAPASLQQLWDHTAHFTIDQLSVPIGGTGHREAFAVPRPDLGADMLYLYHRCFPGGVPQICLLASSDQGGTFIKAPGVDPPVVIAPTGSHPFAVAPSVRKVGDVWTMVYEEGGSAEGTYWATSAEGKDWTQHGALWPGAPYRATPSLYEFQNTVYVFFAQHDPPGSTKLSINFGSGPSMSSLGIYGQGPVLRGSGAPGSAWDGASVSMPRLVFDGAFHWMIYEAGSENFLCGGADNENVFGWGIARSTTLTSWERFAGNPIQQSSDEETCGHDMPQPVVLPSGEVKVYFTADDVSVIRRARVSAGSACTKEQQAPNWREKNETCLPSCGGIGGTQCLQSKHCPTGKTEAGESWDCATCCK